MWSVIEERENIIMKKYLVEITETLQKQITV